MEKQYEAPSSEIIFINENDIISTSLMDSPIVDIDDPLDL